MSRMLKLILAAGFLATAAIAQDNISFGKPKPESAPESQQPAEYKAGMKAMNNSQWKEALDDFSKVQGARNDVMAQALYWQAYNQQKLGRNDDVDATCKRLAKSYGDSPWVPECFQLRANRIKFVKSHNFDIQTGADVDMDEIQAQIDQATAQANMYADRAERGVPKQPFFITTDSGGPQSFIIKTDRINPDDEIKLIALNSMMQQEPDKALPVLRALLMSDKPVEVKRRAMFVLQQSKSPEAQKLLSEMAQSSKELELQRAAIRALAARPKDHTAELTSIYKASSDEEVKRVAQDGLMHAGDAKDLVAITRNEKDADLKRAGVRDLSDMHDPAALAYMEELAK